MAVVESQGLTDFQFSDIHDVPTVCLLIEVFLSRDSFLFPLWEGLRDKKGVGERERNACLFTFLLSPAWNLVFTSEDAVIRRERENGMIKRIRLFREEEHGQSRAFGREVEELLCFSFFPLFLLFFSQDRHTSSSSSSLAWHWKGCNTGRTPVGSRRFSMKQRSNETALGFLGMCRCNRENGGDASIIRNGRNCDTLYSIREGGQKSPTGDFLTHDSTNETHPFPNLLFEFFNVTREFYFFPRWSHWFLNGRDKLIG